MSKRLVVAVMDGAFGFREFSASKLLTGGRRTLVSDVVLDILQSRSVVFEQFNPAVCIEKGGIWKSPDRRVRKHILEHNNAGNSLICIGKSHGAKDLAEILRDLALTGLHYERMGYVQIDANWAPIPNNKNDEIINVPLQFRVWNLYQTGRMGGAMVNGSVFVQREIPKATHFSIETHPQVRNWILDALVWAVESQENF